MGINLGKGILWEYLGKYQQWIQLHLPFPLLSEWKQLISHASSLFITSEFIGKDVSNSHLVHQLFFEKDKNHLK